ncbi:MAG TPA: hypothetical protein VIL72_03905 [Beijerinckiaceae bacterium]
MNLDRLTPRQLAAACAAAFLFGGLGAMARGGGDWTHFLIGGFGLTALVLVLAAVVGRFKR